MASKQRRGIDEDLTVRFDRNLTALSDDEWVDLASVYKVAFAGPPWFEVGRCAVPEGETVPDASPCAVGGFSRQGPSEVCGHCDLPITEVAYPLPSLLADLDEILRGDLEPPPDPDEQALEGNDPDPDAAPEPNAAPAAKDGGGASGVDARPLERVLYREMSRTNGLLLGAMFWRAPAKDLISIAYDKESADLRAFLTDSLPTGKPVLYLDEIFANRLKRPKGNLVNFSEMCRAAARMAGTDVICFRTKSEELKGKAQRTFPEARSVLPIDHGFRDDRWFIIISIPDLWSGRSADPADEGKRALRDPGLAEWLPAERQAEVDLLARLARRCELHGFTPIETPALEWMDLLTAQGGIDQQIFTVGRPLDDAAEDRSSLGLHFDLTVPLSRYVAEHRAELSFPFRRYQHQKVWRGERLSAGRNREFIQFDVDVVGDGTLSSHHDADILRLASELISTTGVDASIRVSDARLLPGLLGDVNPSLVRGLVRAISDSRSGGPSELARRLGQRAVASDVIDRIVTVIADPGSLETARGLSTALPDAIDALDAIEQTLDGLAALGGSAISVTTDLSLVRDLDYYSGFIFETVLPDRLEYGSVCSGGRYDLRLDGRPELMTGVGASIGLTRLFTALLADGVATGYRQSPVRVAMVVVSWDRDAAVLAAAAGTLREQGIGVELSIDGSDELGPTLDVLASRGMRCAAYLASTDEAIVVDLTRPDRPEVRCRASEIPDTVRRGWIDPS